MSTHGRDLCQENTLPNQLLPQEFRTLEKANATKNAKAEPAPRELDMNFFYFFDINVGDNRLRLHSFSVSWVKVRT